MPSRYGYQHQQLRKAWLPQVATGTVRCWRPNCQRLIRPDEPWHLGHDDDDPTKYRGPEHVKCNTSTAATRGNKKRARRQAVTRGW